MPHDSKITEHRGLIEI